MLCAVMRCHPIVAALLLVLLACSESGVPDRAPAGTAGGQWRSYAADPGSSHYSPLAQIDATNFGSLVTAWTWQSADVVWLRDVFAKLGTRKPEPLLSDFQVTPLMVDGALYGSTSIGQVFSLDAATGAERWVHDPRSYLDEKGYLG